MKVWNSYTLEASSYGISLRHDNFGHIGPIKLGFRHESCRQRLALEVRFIICEVAESKIKRLIINAIRLSDRITNKCTLTPISLRRQRRQPLQCQTPDFHLTNYSINFCHTHYNTHQFIPKPPNSIPKINEIEQQRVSKCEPGFPQSREKRR